VIATDKHVQVTRYRDFDCPLAGTAGENWVADPWQQIAREAGPPRQ